MKLEWGRKICCPTCSVHFYDLQRSALSCPACNSEFERSDLIGTKHSDLIMDDVIDVDDKADLAGYEFEEETIDIDLTDDSDELSVKTELEEIKLVDEE